MYNAFQAYSKHGKTTAKTARQAAISFFNTFPQARKCDVIQGQDDGQFFTVTYGRTSEGRWPLSFKDITKKTIDSLPD
jgi:hypothetical protein